MTLRGRGIEIKKLNRERKKKKEEKNEKEGEGKEREKEEKKENEKTSHLTTNGEINVTTTHPVAPANYIMIFNGPKSKTWPPKIFGSGIDWNGLKFGLRC